AGDGHLLDELVRTFARRRTRWLEELTAAVAAADADQLEQTAHRLKGALGALGARPALEHAGVLEALGRSGTMAPAAAALGALEKELDRLARHVAEPGWLERARAGRPAREES